jgi:hypothetical protein
MADDGTGHMLHYKNLSLYRFPDIAVAVLMVLSQAAFYNSLSFTRRN